MRRTLGFGESGGLMLIAADEPGFSARFVDSVAPSLLSAALRLLDASPELALHRAGVAGDTSIPRDIVPGWIAHLLLGTLDQPNSEHPLLDGSQLFDRDDRPTAARLRCMLAFFERVAIEPPRGQFSIERVVVPPRSAADCVRDESPLSPLIVDDAACIEELDRHRQADFANAFLGGGVLSGGCVQEEIRFSVSPELLFGLIVSPRMNDYEAIILRGSERFSCTTGYADTLAFAGAFRDPTPRLDDGTPDTEVVSMDAFHFGKGRLGEEFSEELILREVNKARAAFLFDDRNLPVATGNWGCGAFGCDAQLKAVIQWIAASAEGRDVRYCTFGDPRVSGLADFTDRSRSRFETAGELWRHVRASLVGGHCSVFARINVI